MILPTVRVQHPEDPDLMMIINEKDLTDAHVRWLDEVQSDLSVGKGPRGLWYVKRGDERLSAGFHTAAEADAAMADHTP